MEESASELLPGTSKQAIQQVEKEKKARPTVKRRKRRRARRFSEDSHEMMLKEVNKRYGNKGKSREGELKVAALDTTSGEIQHPASYDRMMARAIEAHLNRLQPEPPTDLLGSNWLCALCQLPRGAYNLGDLYGPYFINLSSACQPPERLVPRQLISTHQQQKGREERKNSPENFTVNSTTKGQMASRSLSASHTNTKKGQGKMTYAKDDGEQKYVEGSLDIWLHGDCALWTPELFLLGARLPSLQYNIHRYWNQKCFECEGVGATIPINFPASYQKEDTLATEAGLSTPGTSSRSNRPRRTIRAKNSTTCTIALKDELVEEKDMSTKYLHFPCAHIIGCRMDTELLICRPPAKKYNIGIN